MAETKISHFARVRTILANDRTFLAYIRTSMAFFVAGVSFIRFFGEEILTQVGAVFVVVGIVLSIIGFYRFYKTKLHIDAIE